MGRRIRPPIIRLLRLSKNSVETGCRLQKIILATVCALGAASAAADALFSDDFASGARTNFKVFEQRADSHSFPLASYGSF
ncbi:MAG: hypothetical protein OXC69_06370, partial [Candidatus Tectomicrobia bacterium]|nr:hypothetical protein [Candidatus Tectomicrobia bacterium]